MPAAKMSTTKSPAVAPYRTVGKSFPRRVGSSAKGLKLRPTEGQETTQTLDGGRVAFPKYFRRDGIKIHKSRALEGYLACMRSNGRK